MSREIKIAPSILAANFARLGEDVKRAEAAGADRIHVDVMDGHFVPNLSMGPAIVRCLRPITELPLEVHLMIDNPDDFLEPFIDAGADSLLIHYEGNNNLHRSIQRTKALGKSAGVVINPATPASVLEAILPDVELVLVMTVNPGYGGQRFIDGTLPKIRQVREMIEHVRPSIELEVDGGVDADTAGRAVDAGADVLVAGTAIFGEPDVRIAMERLRAAYAPRR
jgi:ribulose-phosphate 3-epimerase